MSQLLTQLTHDQSRGSLLASQTDVPMFPSRKCRTSERNVQIADNINSSLYGVASNFISSPRPSVVMTRFVIRTEDSCLTAAIEEESTLRIRKRFPKTDV